MFKKIIGKTLPYTFLAIVVFFSYRTLLQSYFWNDDYTNLYLAQQGLPYRFPYHFNAFIVERLWPLFKLNFASYFSVGMVFYSLAAFLIYLLGKRLFRSQAVAFLAALIFACGYIGQDSMKMMVGDGFGVLSGLVFLLLTTIVFLKYLDKQKQSWFVFVLITLFLALETAPHRDMGLVLALILLDWVNAWKNRKINLSLIFRNLSFLAILFIQYFIHPSSLVLNYIIPTSGEVFSRSPLLIHLTQVDVIFKYLLNMIGTFWNLVVPERLAYILFIEKGQRVETIWTYYLVVIIIFLGLLCLFKLLKSKTFSTKNFLITFFSIPTFAVVWATLVNGFMTDRYGLIPVLNGGLLLFFLLVIFLNKLPASRRSCLISLILTFSVLGIYFMVKPDSIFESGNKYLLSLAFTSSLLLTFFVTRELFLGWKNPKVKIAWVIFCFPAIFLATSHLWFGITTQRDFVSDFAVYTKNFYRDLKVEVPSIDQKTVFLFSAKQPDLNRLGNAMRVGALPSEASIASHYQTVMSNIYLPENETEIVEILRKNPAMAITRVYSFLYQDSQLINTSKTTRSKLVIDLKINIHE